MPGAAVCDGQHPCRRQHWSYHPGVSWQGVAAQAKGCEAEQPVGVGAAVEQQQRLAPPHPAPPPDQPGNADQFQTTERRRGRNSSGLSWIPPPWNRSSTCLEPCMSPQPR